jgi:hypothetical protein
MDNVEDYVANVEGTCGEEKDVVVTFKFEKKNDAINKILKNAQLVSSIGGGIIRNLTFRNYSFRVYSSGKVIFRSIKNREALNKLIADLLS